MLVTSTLHGICDYLELHVEAMAEWSEAGKIRNEINQVARSFTLGLDHIKHSTCKILQRNLNSCMLPRSYNLLHKAKHVCKWTIPCNAAFTCVFDDKDKAISSPLSLLI